MKVLFIGGTGNISSAVSRLALTRGVDLYLLNRGTRPLDVPGAKSIVGDIKNPASVAQALHGHDWDVVVNWIAFINLNGNDWRVGSAGAVRPVGAQHRRTDSRGIGEHVYDE